MMPNDNNNSQKMMNKHNLKVKAFYELIWNNHDLNAIADLLREDFSFRGSLGNEKKGHAGFAGYVDMVHAALGDYQCTVEELVCEQDRVFAKMMFSGFHKGELMGYAATGKTVSWAGAALFIFVDDKISDLWVLGDLKSLENQLRDD